MQSTASYDIAIVGAGIVGLAHAYEASRLGLRVVVVEQDHHCVGASVRNFGFVTVTGQRAGTTWDRAMRSRAVWAQLATQAGIAIEHRGLWLLARDPAAPAVLEAFAATAMGEHCRVHTVGQAQQLAPWLRTEGAQAAMYSPHELRVESRTAIPRLARWLNRSCGVEFLWGEQAIDCDGRELGTTHRRIRARRFIVCPGHPLRGVTQPWFAAAGMAHIRLTRLQMLRVRPKNGLQLATGVMSDLSLVRYRGYADLPAATELKKQLLQKVPASLAHGIHLIAVQSNDGSWVVGDSHHDEEASEPFASEEVDTLILGHLLETVRVDAVEVLERWIGHYPTGHTEDSLVVAPDPAIRAVIVTSGTGASTAFGIAQDVLKTWE
jgi:D-hydroxyproline dehydrogenase subunit beta